MCVALLSRKNDTVVGPGLFFGDELVALTGGEAPPTIRAIVTIFV
jgi:hypothetical protein